MDEFPEQCGDNETDVQHDQQRVSHGEQADVEDDAEDNDSQDSASSSDGDGQALIGATLPDIAEFGRQPTVVYAVFCLLGMGTLLPWNFFITADSYWNYKFRNVSDANWTSTVSSYVVLPERRPSGSTALQYNFFGYLSVASMLPNTLFLLITALVLHRCRQHLLLIVSLAVVCVLFVATTALVPINTDRWQTQFLATTLCIVAAINASSAVFQSGLFGLAAQFPSSSYMSAVMSGQALGAVFACLARVVSVAATHRHQHQHQQPSEQCCQSAAQESAFVYFMLADVTLVISLASYLYISSLDFFKHHTTSCLPRLVTPDQRRFSTQSSQPSVSQLSDTDPASPPLTVARDSRDVIEKRLSAASTTTEAESALLSVCTSRDTSVLAVLNKVRLYALSVTVVFSVTLAVFPVIANKVQPVSWPHSIWARSYFVPVVCYLLFNTSDYIGRVMADFKPWYVSQCGRGTWWLLAGCVARVLLVPALMTCRLPHVLLSTVFDGDLYYAVFIIALGLSNGYLATVCMTQAPKAVASHEQQTASSIMAAALGVGLCVGAFSSNVLIRLL